MRSFAKGNGGWTNLRPRELKELQNRKLRYFISRQLYPFSPYYHRLFDRYKIKPKHIRTAADLKIIPLTGKEDFFDPQTHHGRFQDFILQPNEEAIKKYYPRCSLLWLAALRALRGRSFIEKRLLREYGPIFLTSTSGTTHEPVSFLYSYYDIAGLSRFGSRLMDVLGVGDSERGVNLFPYVPHLAFWQTVFAALAHNNFILSTGGGKSLGTQGNIEAILKVGPQILIGVPGYVYHLLRCARAAGKDFSFVRKVVLGAQAVSPGFKEKISGLLKEMGAGPLDILGTYGFTEAKCAWAECPSPEGVSSGYHLYPDRDIFEVIDPQTGEVQKEGRSGELVYTNIDARGSCVLRYRTADLVAGGLDFRPCPYCRRAVLRIPSDISRAFNLKELQLTKVKGTLVNLNVLSECLASQKAVEEWQIEIRKKDNDPYEVDELVVYVSLADGAPPEALKEEIKKKMYLTNEITPNEISVLPRREMLERVELEVAHKAKRIVDRRPV